MYKRLSLVVIFFICVIFTTQLFAGWVNGYYRSNGTYVQGYWRTEPNEYKFDNKSFTKSNSPYLTDLYNKSYFNDDAYYNTLKRLEDYQKEIDKSNEALYKSLEKLYDDDNENNLYTIPSPSLDNSYLDDDYTDSDLYKLWSDDE